MNCKMQGPDALLELVETIQNGINKQWQSSQPPITMPMIVR
jgi:hypothetical protein